MGFRMSKSFKLAPGVRMTVSKSGVGYSVGGRGARVTRHANGRVSRTVSLPGTGLSHTATLRGSSTRAGGGGRPARSGAGSGGERARQQAVVSAGPPTPGLLAPSWEKQLFKAVVTGAPRTDPLPAIGRSHPDAQRVTAALEGLLQFQAGNHARARELLAWVAARPGELASHPFVTKYLTGATVTVEISAGVAAALPMSTATVALAAAELHQEAGDLAAAIGTVERIEDPDVFAALSLTELYVESGRHQDAVDLTNGVTNVDDATALLCVLRGRALHELGFHDAAREAFKEALRVRSRPATIRHRALIERAGTYLAQRKVAMARKDLERVLAEDASFPGLRDALAQLPG